MRAKTKKKPVRVVPLPSLKGVGTMPHKMAQNVLNELATSLECEKKFALLAIVLLCQRGGLDPGRKHIEVKAEHVTCTLSHLRSAINEHCTEGSVRKLARGLRDQIRNCAINEKVIGPLYSRIKEHYPDIPLQGNDVYLCFDFFAKDPNVPDRVREALVRYANNVRKTPKKKKRRR